MNPDHTIPALSVGLALGDDGAVNRLWEPVVTRLMDDVAAASAGLESEFRVNVIYHVEGRLLKNDFVGVRVGRYSKPESLLLVQVALPAASPGDLREVVERHLTEAVEQAQAYAQRRGLAPSLASLLSVVEDVTKTRQ